MRGDAAHDERLHSVAFNVQAFRVAVHLPTGSLRILRNVHAADAGQVMNRRQCQGQVESGVAQAIGAARHATDRAGPVLALLRHHRLMRDTAALAARHGVLLHTHLAGTADEAAFCQSRFGCMPLEYLDACGWLRPGTWLAHGIHFTPSEMQRLGVAQVGVTHCACSNHLLASGTCAVCALEAAALGQI